MNKEIEDIIAKNLPQHVGEVLNKRLVQADKDAAELEMCKKDIKNLNENNSALLKRISEQDTIERIQKETEKLKEDLEIRERNLKITVLTLQVDEANKRADVARELAFALFKNPTYKTIEQQNGMMPIKTSYKDYAGNISESVVTHPTSNTISTTIIPE